MTRAKGIHRSRRRSEAGFTMIEAMIATAMMAAILGAIATVTAQWLPNWNRGFAGVQRNELLALGLDRLVADLAAAEFVPAARDPLLPIFEGGQLSVTFVRSTFGPNSRNGLEVVRLAEIASDRGPTLVRTRAPFMPVETERDFRPIFSDPVVLLRAPYRITFAYAAAERTWRDTWHELPLLPRAVRMQVRDAATNRVQAVSTATLVHAEIPPDCIRAEVIADCLTRQRNPAQGEGSQNPAAAPARPNAMPGRSP